VWTGYTWLALRTKSQLLWTLHYWEYLDSWGNICLSRRDTALQKSCNIALKVIYNWNLFTRVVHYMSTSGCVYFSIVEYRSHSVSRSRKIESRRWLVSGWQNNIPNCASGRFHSTVFSVSVLSEWSWGYYGKWRS